MCIQEKIINIFANKSPIGTNCLNSHADIPVDFSIKKKKQEFLHRIVNSFRRSMVFQERSVSRIV